MTTAIMAFQGTFTPGSAVSSLNSDVEISVSCKNLKDEDLVSKSDPTCVLFVRMPASGQSLDERRRLLTLSTQVGPPSSL